MKLPEGSKYLERFNGFICDITNTEVTAEVHAEIEYPDIAELLTFDRSKLTGAVEDLDYGSPIQIDIYKGKTVFNLLPVPRWTAEEIKAAEERGKEFAKMLGKKLKPFRMAED